MNKSLVRVVTVFKLDDGIIPRFQLLSLRVANGHVVIFFTILIFYLKTKFKLLPFQFIPTLRPFHVQNIIPFDFFFKVG